jgi:lysophospholipase L1-like esterase
MITTLRHTTLGLLLVAVTVGATIEWSGSANSDGQPFSLSFVVPEGNHRVTVTLGHETLLSSTTVLAEARRVMLAEVVTAPGELVTREFIVNTRTPALAPPPPHAPGGNAVTLNDHEAGSPTWDDQLTLHFTGSAPQVARLTLEPVDRPTVYLVGDSTVTDQRHGDGASWGQVLPLLFGSGVAVANHAESGQTLKSFLSELRLAKVLATLRAGDYLFIQFGHNDQKANWPQTHADATHVFPAHLRAYLAEARARGATPVLLTSPERRFFEADGTLRDTHGDYPAAVRAVAAAEGVALIDLHAASRALYLALGPEDSARLFADAGHDRTHHNFPGAALLARAVAAGISTCLPDLAVHLDPALPPFDPHQPPSLEELAVFASLGHPAAYQAPRGD